MSAHGPFSSEREAHAAALELGNVTPGEVILSATQRRDMLIRACRAARVETGEFDDRIIAWLAQWEDSTVVVVAGLVERAYRAGREVAQ